MSGPLRAVVGFPFGTAFGGSERLLATFLSRAGEARVAPHLVTFADGPFIDEVRGWGVPVSVVDPGRFREPWKHAAAVARLTRLLRRERPDIAVSWLPRVQTVLGPAAAAARVPLVHTEHELPADRLARVALALPIRRVVANSTASREAVARVWPHREATVVWPGVDVPARERPPRAGRPIVVVVGRLLGWKGQDRAIAAVELLRERGLDVTLEIVGAEAHGVEAGTEARLRALAAPLGDRVVFRGHVPDPSGLVAGADVLLSASEAEPFGMVLVEAMALGTPVVAVGAAGPLDIVEDGVSGTLARDGSPAALARALEAVLRDPARAAAMAAAARRRYEERFTSGRWLAGLAAELRAAAG